MDRAETSTEADKQPQQSTRESNELYSLNISRVMQISWPRAAWAAHVLFLAVAQAPSAAPLNLTRAQATTALHWLIFLTWLGRFSHFYSHRRNVRHVGRLFQPTCIRFHGSSGFGADSDLLGLLLLQLGWTNCAEKVPTGVEIVLSHWIRGILQNM